MILISYVFFINEKTKSYNLWNITVNNSVSYDESKNEPISFSKDNKNVLFLGFDSIGTTELFESKKIWNSQNTFDNFINYKNTYSGGLSTILGFYSLIGGWMNNPLAFSDKRINLFDLNENFENLDARVNRISNKNYYDLIEEYWKQFINSINNDKYDLKLTYSMEFYKQASEIIDKYKPALQKMKNDFKNKTQPESIHYMYKDLKYNSKYDLDNDNISKLNKNINDVEKIYKNYKTHQRKGKFNFYFSEAMRPPFYDYVDNKLVNTNHNKGSFKYQLKHIDNLFSKLKYDGVWDNTLIIMSSDHGISKREEPIMLIKPWDEKGKYIESENLMSNSDFPMILKHYLKNDFNSSFYERAAKIKPALKYSNIAFIDNPIVSNNRTKIINFAGRGSSDIKINDQMIVGPNFDGIIIDEKLDSANILLLNKEQKRIVNSKIVYPNINPYENKQGDKINKYIGFS